MTQYDIKGYNNLKWRRCLYLSLDKCTLVLYLLIKLLQRTVAYPSPAPVIKHLSAHVTTLPHSYTQVVYIIFYYIITLFSVNKTRDNDNNNNNNKGVTSVSRP